MLKEPGLVLIGTRRGAIMTLKIMTHSIITLQHNDSQNNGILYIDIVHNDTQHNYIQLNDTQHNDTQFMTLSS
jgi:hypothetical protein